VIRRATAADAPGIARVQVETWRTAYAGLIDAAFLDALSVPAGASRWESHIAAPDAAVYVALGDGDGHGDEVVGFASTGPARDADAPATTGEVYAIYVHPSAQRRGLGAGLLGTALGDLAAGGCAEALLWVLTGNAPARGFYEARGGTPDGEAREIDVGGALVDEVRYRFVLAPASSRAFRR
jgi:ribosomal protein S18 acetylase RimI-like enzyme